SAMVSEIKAYREPSAMELKHLDQFLAKSESNSAISIIQQAIDILQDEINDESEQDIAVAFNVMEDEKKAAMFIRMKGVARNIWLRRHISLLVMNEKELYEKHKKANE
ncbi:hypothetical protein As57867_005416, partial [Aphanomyces stellatus]